MGERKFGLLEEKGAEIKKNLITFFIKIDNSQKIGTRMILMVRNSFLGIFFMYLLIVMGCNTNLGCQTFITVTSLYFYTNVTN